MQTEIYRFNGTTTQTGLQLIYEDNHLICVIKPRGVLSQSDGSEKDDMLSIVKNDISARYNKRGNVFLGLVHRLDTNTAGTMVFAKTSKCASRLDETIRKREFYKGYFAVVTGTLKNEGGYLFNILSKDESKNIVFEDPKGKECVLYYEKIAERGGNTLVFAFPITGRTHQIRAQFALSGHPLPGDVKYGGCKNENAFSLWSSVAAFKHPTKDLTMICQSIPDKFSYFTAFETSLFETYLDDLDINKLKDIKNADISKHIVTRG